MFVLIRKKALFVAFKNTIAFKPTPITPAAWVVKHTNHYSRSVGRIWAHDVCPADGHGAFEV